MAEVKFCGITRSADAAEAVRLGARYIGVILASGPRLLRPERARTVLAKVPDTIGRVGVFGAGAPDAIADEAVRAGVEVVQLHGDPDAATVTEMRRRFAGPIWAAVRVEGEILPASAEELFSVADAVVLDARSDRGLGGTGVALPWSRLAERLERLRAHGGAALVLAGGLTPANVGEAIRALSPDVVDVSSGVESAPGIKDHSLMGAFAGAADPRRGVA